MMHTMPHEFSKITSAWLGAEVIGIRPPNGLNMTPGIQIMVNGNPRLAMTLANARCLIVALLAAMAEQQQQQQEES